MKFADSIREALDTKWSYINTFDVSFEIPYALQLASGWDNSKDGRNINLHIVSIDTPQFTNSPIEVFVGNRWAIHNGRDELYRFSITFRDRDQMDLYRKFVRMYSATKDLFFDDAKMVIDLSKDADWLTEANSKLFTFEDTLIESVSSLSFSNTTENQIAEFTVNFKTATPNIRGSWLDYGDFMPKDFSPKDFLSYFK
jgi:hypothetical protein